MYYSEKNNYSVYLGLLVDSLFCPLHTEKKHVSGSKVGIQFGTTYLININSCNFYAAVENGEQVVITGEFFY